MSQSNQGTIEEPTNSSKEPENVYKHENDEPNPDTTSSSGDLDSKKPNPPSVSEATSTKLDTSEPTPAKPFVKSGLKINLLNTNKEEKTLTPASTNKVKTLPAKSKNNHQYKSSNSESALYKFKGYLEESHTENKKLSPAYKSSPKSNLSPVMRRDPTKTKRDIERDKFNKTREEIAKKIETGLFPPGMEIENNGTPGGETSENHNSVSPNNKQHPSEHQPPDSKRFSPNDRYDKTHHPSQGKMTDDTYFDKYKKDRSPYSPQQKYDRQNRSHSRGFSGKRQDRGPRKQEKALTRTNSNLPYYVSHAGSLRHSPPVKRRRRSIHSPHSPPHHNRNNRPSSPQRSYDHDARRIHRRSPRRYHSRSSSPRRPRIRSPRGNRASKERFFKELLERTHPTPSASISTEAYNAPCFENVSQPYYASPANQYYPPPHNLEYTSLTANNYSVSPDQTMQPVYPPQAVPAPSMPYYSDYPSANITDSTPPILPVPPVSISRKQLARLNNKRMLKVIPSNTKMPKGEPSELDLNMQNSPDIPAITTNPDEKAEIIKRCQDAVQKLDFIHLPNRLTMDPNTESISASQYKAKSSPFKRNLHTWFEFTTKPSNQTNLLSCIIATIEYEGIISNTKNTPISQSESVATQTDNFNCDTCMIKGLIVKKSVSTMTSFENKSRYTQVEKQFMESTTNETSGDSHMPKSLMHMTPAQILLAELSAKSKQLQRTAAEAPNSSYSDNQRNLMESRSNFFMTQNRSTANSIDQQQQHHFSVNVSNNSGPLYQPSLLSRNLNSMDIENRTKQTYQGLTLNSQQSLTALLEGNTLRNSNSRGRGRGRGYYGQQQQMPRHIPDPNTSHRSHFQPYSDY